MLLDILDQAGCMFDLRCILGQDSEVMHGDGKAVTTLKAKIPAKILTVISLLLFILLLSHPAVPENAFTQSLKLIYDGRLSLAPTKLFPSEEALMKEKILPAARNLWHEQESDLVCAPGFEATALDSARGSFTRPKSDQRAILYRYCETGHNMALNGIAIIENAQVVTHIVYEGGWDNSIGAMPDLNGNGLSGILVASGGTNQGVTWKSISIIEISGNRVTKFGQTETYSDNCGVGEKNGKAEACRLFVKVGKTPVFYREAFVNKGVCDGGTWTKSGTPGQISLKEDETEYQFIK